MFKSMKWLMMNLLLSLISTAWANPEREMLKQMREVISKGIKSQNFIRKVGATSLTLDPMNAKKATLGRIFITNFFSPLDKRLTFKINLHSIHNSGGKTTTFAYMEEYLRKLTPENVELSHVNQDYYLKFNLDYTPEDLDQVIRALKIVFVNGYKDLNEASDFKILLDLEMEKLGLL